MSSSSSSTQSISSWETLLNQSTNQPIGASLHQETELRQTGKGSPHVQSTLRLFDSNAPPLLTLHRDHAGWCPYCQKTMLLIEEKEIPIQINLMPMRSYGEKPASYMRLVRGGLLPALTVEKPEDGRSQTITESQVIMELLDAWHPPQEGYKAMMPLEEMGVNGQARYQALASLERELFSWWCTLLFRPEMGGGGRGGGIMGMFGGGGGDAQMSGAMKGFLTCLDKVEAELQTTSGPWFFDFASHPTMIDFIYVSHVERMLASAAYWKGLNLRSEQFKSNRYRGLNAWLEAFEQRECYLAYKSDYYTHVKDIPPQYGPGYFGGLEGIY